MKKYITLSFLLVSVFVKAQTIQQVSLNPGSPTETDNITLFADLSFPSGGCNLENQNVVQVGNTIYVNVFHCSGMLTYICYITDSISLGNLPVGTYDVITQLFYGTQNISGNCTSYAQVDQKSTTIVVSSSTGIKDILTSTPLVRIESKKLIVSNLYSQYVMELYDGTGKIVTAKKMSATDNELLLNVSPGFYFYSLSREGKKEFTGKIFVR